jgi:hypothetical protein
VPYPVLELTIVLSQSPNVSVPIPASVTLRNRIDPTAKMSSVQPPAIPGFPSFANDLRLADDLSGLENRTFPGIER